MFDKLDQKFTAIELDEREDADEIQSVLGEITGARTVSWIKCITCQCNYLIIIIFVQVPRVFVNGDCLGGGSDVKALYESGKLATLVGK